MSHSRRRTGTIACLGILAALLVVALVVIFRPNGDVGAFIQHPATAAWAQVFGAVAAIGAAWFIARRDHRQAELRDEAAQRSRRTAVLAIVDECITVLDGLDKKASAKAFTGANVASSIEKAKSSAEAVASLPLLELDAEEVRVVARVRTHMATAARRSKFIQAHIRAASDWSKIEFSGLLKQVSDLRNELPSK